MNRHLFCSSYKRHANYDDYSNKIRFRRSYTLATHACARRKQASLQYTTSSGDSRSYSNSCGCEPAYSVNVDDDGRREFCLKMDNSSGENSTSFRDACCQKTPQNNAGRTACDAGACCGNYGRRGGRRGNQHRERHCRYGTRSTRAGAGRSCCSPHRERRAFRVPRHVAHPASESTHTACGHDATRQASAVNKQRC